MVRLKVLLLNSRKEVAKFQFQYGTIKSRKWIVKLWHILSFNSNMVRLKASLSVRYSQFIEFQFQYGTIKSLQIYVFLKSLTWFQFQYGTIKRKNNKKEQISFLCFNSNMVRLKECHQNVYAYRYNEFQFQYGTIKRIHQIAPVVQELSFNSNMVRLKGKSTNSIVVETTCFNSNMVRLKADPNPDPLSENPFQFQYGTIKSSFHSKVLISF